MAGETAFGKHHIPASLVPQYGMKAGIWVGLVETLVAAVQVWLSEASVLNLVHVIAVNEFRIIFNLTDRCERVLISRPRV